MNELINEARADVDLAVSDLEEAIDRQKEEYNQAVMRFQRAWQEPWQAGGVNVSKYKPSVVPLLAVPQEEIETRIADVRKSIDAISDEVESDIKLFKQRWDTTTDRLETLPTNMTKMKSLASVRRPCPHPDPTLTHS